ncbi:MAG TPA: helix-turn-helix domain-containing protein, partial [Thermomicrobiales bacterium]|nr:helix-turn-helix domain-containing protein [Thermomicrobiales bacterium]
MKRQDSSIEHGPGPSAAGAEELSAFCPHFHHAIELLGGRWTGAIVRALMGGKRHFNEIAAAIPGLSARMLSDR